MQQTLAARSWLNLGRRYRRLASQSLRLFGHAPETKGDGHGTGPHLCRPTVQRTRFPDLTRVIETPTDSVAFRASGRERRRADPRSRSDEAPSTACPSMSTSLGGLVLAKLARLSRVARPRFVSMPVRVARMREVRPGGH